jgi:hypothetical protein
MLMTLLKDIFSSPQAAPGKEEDSEVRSVLNVGGGSKTTAIPEYFTGWRHDLLDIDARGAPDIVCDARQLNTLAAGIYDAVYCSHNLEHYYRHDGLKVLRGFLHVLNDTGFAEIRVPDIAKVIAALHQQQLELDDVLYVSPAGPISAHDVVYGLQTEIEESGQDFYAHKTGFTPKSLSKMLLQAGFHKVIVATDPFLAVHALAFKAEPTKEQSELLRQTWNMEPA